MVHLHLHVCTLSIVSAFAADGDPPGRVEFYSEAQSCDQSCSAWEKNENERLAALCLSLERNQRCSRMARPLMRWRQWWMDEEKVVTEKRTTKRALSTETWREGTHRCLCCDNQSLFGKALFANSVSGNWSVGRLSDTFTAFFSLFFCSRAEGKHQCKHFRLFSHLSHTHHFPCFCQMLKDYLLYWCQASFVLKYICAVELLMSCWRRMSLTYRTTMTLH